MSDSPATDTPPGAAGTFPSEAVRSKPHDLVEAAGMPAGAGEIKVTYDPRLTNEDLAPLKNQTWTSYNIFAFWMSDVHSVGGYVTAGGLGDEVREEVDDEDADDERDEDLPARDAECEQGA